MRVSPGNHISGDAALPVGRPGQRDQLPLSCNHISCFDSVSNRPDVRITRAHLVVHLNSATLTYSQSGSHGQLRFGSNPDGKDNDVRREPRALLRADDEAAFIIRVESVYSIVQLDVYTMTNHALMNELGHLTIQRRHQLIRHFDDRYVQTSPCQVFCHFETNKAPSYHHSSSS